MSGEHPTYPHPVVREALCEIHFELADGVTWDPAWPGELFKQIQDEFPGLEPATEVGLEVTVGPGGILQGMLPPRHRMRYHHATRPLMLQLSAGVFTVNLLPKYPGWEQMRDDVTAWWNHARVAVKAASVSRVGLRFINHIPRRRPNEKVGEWLAAGPHVPPAVLLSQPGFLYRSQTRPTDQDRLIVTLAEAGDVGPGEGGAIVFDIDAIAEKRTTVEGEAVACEADRLHQVVWDVFASSMTPRLERLLLEGRGGV